MEEDKLMREARKRAKRWVAGKTMEEALKEASRLSALCVVPVLNILGEAETNRAKVIGYANDYKELVEAVGKEVGGKMRSAEISIKPTQIGLEINRATFRENLMNISQLAHAQNGSDGVWLNLDMERPQYALQTLGVYVSSLSNCKKIRITVPVSHTKAGKMLDEVLSYGGHVRLCRGAYGNGKKMSVGEAREALLDAAKSLDEARGSHVIATNDLYVIRELSKLGCNVEVELLRGVSEETLKEALQSYTGGAVREYVPFGSEWLAYCGRRDPWFNRFAASLGVRSMEETMALRKQHLGTVETVR